MEKGSFTVYKSSAGSGKTFTLVREYLNLVIANPDRFRNVLAITFTNRAANEMKERVVKVLRDFSAVDASELEGTSLQMLKLITEDTALTPMEIRSRATRVLNNILHNYTEFAIGTIDSFTHKITRIFAYDLKLPLNFEVEMDQGRFLNEVIQRLIERLGNDSRLTEILVGFLEKKTSSEQSWKIEKDLKKTAKVLLQEGSAGYIERLHALSLDDFRSIRAYVFGEISKIEHGLREMASEALSLIRQKQIDPTSFSHGARGLPSYFGKFMQHPMKFEGPNSYVEKTFGEDSWTSRKATPDQVSRIEGAKEEFTRLFIKMEEIREQNLQRYPLLKMVGARIFQITVLNEISKIIDDLREEKNIVHISEFNERIAEIVSNEPVPFIYERMGEKYRHILIDEFQDTSLLQWRNLLPLFENSLASNQFNMVVGDTKQSIYRFRSGEPEQFERLPAIPGAAEDHALKEREHILRRHYSPVNLGRNYRSSKDIVNFNNAFFTFVRKFLPEGYQEYYGSVMQEPVVDKPGRVEVRFIGDDFYEANLNLVLETVNNLRDDGYALKDIAILCRANDRATKIARHLLQNRLNVVSSESLLVNSSRDVRFIISWFRLLNDPTDQVAVAHILYYLSETGFIGKESMKRYITKREGGEHLSTWNILEAIHSKEEKISLKKLESFGIYDLAGELIRRFCPHRQADPYLVFFMDVIAEQSTGTNDAIPLFLEWWDEESDNISISVPGSIDAVRVMTIHKAKGLEFPVVIYPFADQSVKTTRNELWLNLGNNEIPGLEVALTDATKKLQETAHSHVYDEEYAKSVVDFFNLLYVVMTRPRERLYVFTKQEDKIKERPDSVQQLLYSYLIHELGFDPSQDVFQSGREISEKPGKSINGNEPLKLDNYDVSGWHQRVLLSYNAPGYWEAGDPEIAGKWGSLVHFVLSQITAPAETTGVLVEMMESGVITGDEHDELSRLLEELFSHDEVKELFNPRFTVIAEREIIDGHGAIFRPDRIMISGNEAIVVDFKTGKVRDSHKEQVRRYGYLLEEIGYDVIKMILLYISEKPEIVRVEK
jgi:ATP-dependent exoDNAse (exonuclease V) beta subunit